MKTNKDDFFTIGEISKIMGINAKSIRYYDKIGVLPPAMVDPETGYRYYQPSQLGILSAIQVCVELGIPLQEFSNYCSNGSVNAGDFLEYATKISQQRMLALQESMNYIENLKEQIEKADKLLHTNQIIEYELPEKHYIVKEITQDISLPNFNKILGELHMTATKSGFRPGLNFGKIAIFQGVKLQKLFAYSDVSSDATGDNIMILPPANCASIHTTVPQLENAPALFSAYFSAQSESIVFESEMISSVYHTETPNYELKCICI